MAVWPRTCQLLFVLPLPPRLFFSAPDPSCPSLDGECAEPIYWPYLGHPSTCLQSTVESQPRILELEIYSARHRLPVRRPNRQLPSHLCCLELSHPEHSPDSSHVLLASHRSTAAQYRISNMDPERARNGSIPIYPNYGSRSVLIRTQVSRFLFVAVAADHPLEPGPVENPRDRFRDTFRFLSAFAQFTSEELGRLTGYG